MLNFSQSTVWNIREQVVFDLNVQTEAHQFRHNIVCLEIHRARNLVFQEVRIFASNTFGLDMRQLCRRQKKKPRQRIKCERVIKSEPIEDTEKQQNIPPLIFDAVDLSAESTNAH